MDIEQLREDRIQAAEIALSAHKDAIGRSVFMDDDPAQNFSQLLISLEVYAARMGINFAAALEGNDEEMWLEPSSSTTVAGIPFGVHCEHIDGDLKVQIAWVGEGISGNYNPQDVEDQPLLRFQLLRRMPLSPVADADGWGPIEDTSYRCGLDAGIQDETKSMAAAFIMNAVKDSVDMKAACQQMTEIRLRDVLDFGESMNATNSVSPGL